MNELETAQHRMVGKLVRKGSSSVYMGIVTEVNTHAHFFGAGSLRINNKLVVRLNAKSGGQMDLWYDDPSNWEVHGEEPRTDTSQSEPASPITFSTGREF